MSDEAKLPPWSEEAEQGVLGCVILGYTSPTPRDCLTVCVRQRVEPEWFYDLKHRKVFQTLMAMRTDGIAIDLITLSQRLKDHGHLDSVGGMGYVSSLADKVPSAANLEYYLDILRRKWVLRNLVAECIHMAHQAEDYVGKDVDALVDRARARFEQFALDTKDPSQASSLLRPAGDWAEVIFERWFGEGKLIEEPGLLLPGTAFGQFPFKIRPKEMTVVLGQSGQGKTTLLSYVSLHLMAQGARCVVASMEMAPESVLETLLRQLLGVKREADCEAGKARFMRAVAWLNARCEILDFRGIINHRTLLDEFKRAADRGFTVFTVDNLNKLGLMEDDMAAHGQAANEFHGFAVGSGAHLFMVNHVNKAGHSRGSLRWTDVADNVFRVEANTDKGEKLADGFQMLREHKISQEEFQETYKEELKEYDGRFVLTKQRLQGSIQNGARTLWFLYHGSQYANHAESRPHSSICWLEKWTGGAAEIPKAETGVSGHPDGAAPQEVLPKETKEDEKTEGTEGAEEGGQAS